MSERLSTGDPSPTAGLWPGRRRLARGAMVAVLGLSLLGGPLATDSVRSMPATQSGLSAVITGSGNGVNIRADASYDGEVLIQIAEGTGVTLRIDQVDTVLDPDGTTRWWPISVYGIDGWVTGFYLSDTGTATVAGVAEVAPDASEAPVAASADSTAPTARVADPGGVNVRTRPDPTSEVITLAAGGSLVVLRTDTTGFAYDFAGTEWWPVEVNGQPGWVVGAFLSSGVDESAPVDVPAAPAGQSADAVFAPGTRVMVETGSPDGLNIRAEPAPGTDVVGYVRPGDVVQVMGGPDGFSGSATGWYVVTNGSVTGYVDGDFLVLADQFPAVDVPVASGAPVVDPTVAAGPDGSSPLTGTSGRLGAGDGDGVNIRETVGTSGAVVVTVPDGTAADVLDGPFYDADGAEWVYVLTGSGEGFVLARLVGAGDGTAPVATAAPTDTPATERAEPTATPADVSATETAEPTTAPEETEAPDETETPEPTATPEETEAPAPTEPVETEPAAPSAGVGTGTFVFPVAGQISQNYGCTSLPFYPLDPNSGCPFHDALDVAAPQGTPIVATDGGTVLFAGFCDCGLGFYVEIDHGNGYTSVYGHMASQPYVATGQAVAQGDVIGPIGSTGFSTGPHVHFGVSLNGSTIDPRSVLSSLSFAG